MSLHSSPVRLAAAWGPASLQAPSTGSMDSQSRPGHSSGWSTARSRLRSQQGQAWTNLAWLRHGTELLDTGLCIGPDEDKADFPTVGQTKMRYQDLGAAIYFNPNKNLTAKFYPPTWAPRNAFITTP